MAVVINGTTGITSVNGSASAPSVTGTDTDTGIVYGTNTLSLATGGTTAVTVDSSQNVGIGTASPGYKLQVVGSISLGNSTAQPTIFLNNTSVGSWKSELQFVNSGTPKWSTGVDIGAAGNNNFYWYDAVAGAERMRIDSSGNVGIGTSSPTGKLNVSGSGQLFNLNGGGTSGIYSTIGNTGGSFVLGIQNSVGNGPVLGATGAYDALLGTQNATNQIFITNNTERMRIDSSGNVGVGTNTPSSYGKFTVVTQNADTSELLHLERLSSGTFRVRSPSVGTVSIGSPYADSFLFETSGIERMRLDTSGNLLVGTTSTLGTGAIQVRGGLRGDNSSGDANFTIEARGGTIYSASIYNSTTAVGASVSITGVGGFLQRSTSSIKYKTDVEDLDLTKSDLIYQMRPVWYRSKCETDRKDWSYYGLIAEELAEIEPRLVHWGIVKEDGTQEPEGVMYDRLTVLLIAEMKKQQVIIEQLRADVAQLKGQA